MQHDKAPAAFPRVESTRALMLRFCFSCFLLLMQVQATCVRSTAMVVKHEFDACTCCSKKAIDSVPVYGVNGMPLAAVSVCCLCSLEPCLHFTDRSSARLRSFLDLLARLLFHVEDRLGLAREAQHALVGPEQRVSRDECECGEVRLDMRPLLHHDLGIG